MRLKLAVIIIIRLISLILVARAAFPFMSIMLSAWFGLYFFLELKGYLKRLNKQEKRLYYFTLLVLPLSETIIKIAITKEFISYSWLWLNKIEHLSFAIALAIVLYPFFKKSLQNLSALEGFVLLVGSVVMIGNINEFLEYGLRVIMGLTETWRFSAYYQDTIYDMIINVVGGFLGASFLRAPILLRGVNVPSLTLI